MEFEDDDDDEILDFDELKQSHQSLQTKDKSLLPRTFRRDSTI